MMPFQSLFRYPIIQAAMAGGSNTPRLVAAVSNAGGLGSLAGSLLTPAALESQVREIRSLTDKPFLINLFVQETPSPDAATVEAAKQLLEPVIRRMGLGSLPTPTTWCEDFQARSASSPVSRLNACMSPEYWWWG